MIKINFTRLGRPPGPSPERGERPWDPGYMNHKERLALKYIAANPNKPRWLIAKKANMSPSRLSILSCSKLGQKYLKLFQAMAKDELIKYTIYD